tara:strand:- start:3015 stop:4091 length:1077 start_codon:yes stop_codon:yes gene_type:complete
MSTNLPEQQPSEEIDLGQLFKLIGSAFDRFFRFIGNILNKIFLTFVWLVFFTKKHFIKIIIAGVIGAGLGFVKNKTEKKVYHSTAIIKQNYDTGEHLFNTINYYNSLFQQKDSIETSKILNITTSKSNEISGLEMASNLTENQKLQLFNEYVKSLDSVLASTVEYKDFLENSKDYNYNIQKITLKSFTKDNFNNVLRNIIENIEKSEFFLNQKLKKITNLNNEDMVIEQSLEESKTLQAVYTQVLKQQQEELPLGGSTNIVVGGANDKNVTKEFELFSKDLDLRRELVKNESDRKNLEEIIEIMSIQDGDGTLHNEAKIFGIATSWAISIGIKLALLTFLVLVLIEFIRFLERYKDKI